MKTTGWIRELKRKLGSGIVSTAPSVLKEHDGDAWDAHALPDVVVTPRNTKQIQELVKFCYTRSIPLTARGAGRGYVGGCVPVHGGVSLSLKKMNRILEISAADSVAVVESGVITGDLQAAVKKHGLFYPPDPASAKESSIGGNIATNAGGPRCLKYGVTRNYVLGLDVVLANGDCVKLGGRTHKNKLGFNLADLFVGSEGMLGIVTRATLRLIPHPPARAVLLSTFTKASHAAAAVNAIQKTGLLPSVLEVADSLTLEAARKYMPGSPEGNALILVEIDGQPSSVRNESKQVESLLKSCHALRVRRAFDGSQAEKLWDIRRGFSYSLRATGLTKLNEDVVVPRGRLVDLFGFAGRLQSKFKIQVACFGHAGDGNIHVNLMVDPATAHSPANRQALDLLFKQVLSWRGSITGEHGVGLAKKPWWNIATTPELRKLHRSIKQALDPKGILNPGKFLD
ncbi:MAG: FAD-linked oxidase C-terminal domain-containing protein [Methylacidiphilales bacterium]|nr:FAD-linked oxidase C-terminal domain-containing protein [Candidatus Methylacidiphilales bacterium]